MPHRWANNTLRGDYMKYTLKSIILSIFGEGSGTGDGSNGDAGNTANNFGITSRESGENKVLYGIQDDEFGAADQEKAEQPKTIEERKKAYKDLINGEYKDLYTEDTQNIINKRFKETKALEQKINETQPIIEMLMDKYGVNDINALNSAIEGDNSYWEEEAYQAGMDIEQFKKYKRLERENKALLEAERTRQNEIKVMEQVNRWNAEAEILAQKFPGFNLQEEAMNPQFADLLRKNVPMEHAYKLIHFDEIINSVGGQVASITEKRVADDIVARGSRPTEAGSSSNSAFTYKKDVKSLTKKDREEIARRAANGEQIRF